MRPGGGRAGGAAGAGEAGLAAGGGRPGPERGGVGSEPSAAAVRRLVAAVLVGLAVYDLAYVVVLVRSPGVLPFGDFFALWSFARFAQEHGGAGVYDAGVLQAFQRGLDPAFPAAYPFAYPPFFLLMLWPLGWLPQGVGFAAWSVATLGFYVAAALGRGWRSLAGVALVVAPTTLLGLVSGQSGFLAGGLMVGGLRLAGQRPVLAGAMLGVLAYKPQLGVLVPVALAAAGQWRCVAAAGVTVLGLAGASGAAFGWGVWADWARAMPVYWGLFEANRGPLDHLMPTVGATLRWCGAGAGAMRWGQALAGLVVAAAVWVCGRRAARAGAAADGAGQAALVPVGAFLATPYAYVYDLPMVTAAVVLAALRGGRAFAAWELAAGVLALVAPLAMVGAGAWPVEAPLLAGVFWVLVRRGEFEDD